MTRSSPSVVQERSIERGTPEESRRACKIERCSLEYYGRQFPRRDKKKARDRCSRCVSLPECEIENQFPVNETENKDLTRGNRIKRNGGRNMSVIAVSVEETDVWTSVTRQFFLIWPERERKRERKRKEKNNRYCFYRCIFRSIFFLFLEE